MNQLNHKKKKKRKNVVCPICERPHYKTGCQCCATCAKKLQEIKPIVEPFSNRKRVSIDKVVNIKIKYNQSDVFEFLKKNPFLWNTLDKSKKRLELKRELKSTFKTNDYKNYKYEKWTGDIPQYIYETMKKHPSKEFLTLSGNRLNPLIHYRCLKCDKEQAQLYSELMSNRSHNCSALKSTGEVIVENFLINSKLKINTQYDTLKCINPITARQLPYDIEIPKFKIIIEIQGEQHDKYIEYFHGGIENFYYQKRKDDYKKLYAEKKGYKVIYIYYDEIQNGNYKNKINNSIEDHLRSKSS